MGKMMGTHDGQQEMFNYAVNLDRRVRAEHPLRAVRAAVDFNFVRAEVAHCYGYSKRRTECPLDSKRPVWCLLDVS